MRAKVSIVLAACVLAALPVLAQPVATESLTATGLSLTPQIAYESAVLRIAGPEGYEGKSRFTGSDAIQVDLTAFSRRADTRLRQNDAPSSEIEEDTRLPDGRYKYEVVFWSAGDKAGVQSGIFFVEGGVAIGRAAKQDQLAGLREDLARESERITAAASEGFSEATETLAESDWIAIVDGVDDGLTYLSLDSDSPAANQYFLMANNLGDLVVAENDTFSYTSTTPKMTFLRGGGVGVNTTAPILPLHVVNPGTFRQVLLTAGYSGYDAELQVGDAGLWILDDDGQSIARFNHSASQGALVVDAAGVGIGTTAPEEDLHVRAIDPQVLVESTGSATGRTLAYMKNNGDVRMFWENTGSGDIWQMSLLSTVLQMASPTGAGKFRVRKNGGLQALTGSTEIMALNSTGDLTVKSVTETSSRAEKRSFASVDAASVLEKVAALPISEWSYKADSPSVRHLGPMAEDFHAAFGLGKTDKGITSVDTSGVALAAIQGLNQKLAEKDARISELEQRLLELEEMVQALAEH